MKHIVLFLSLLGLILIPLGAWIDIIFFKTYSYKGYLIQCAIEWYIFVFGVFIGTKNRGYENGNL